MGQTITEKILSRASGKKVRSGDLVWCAVDKLMTHDPCSPGVIGIFQKEFGKDARIWDPNKHIMIPDHFIFTSDKRARENIELMRAFAKKQGNRYFYDVGTENYHGVCHMTLAEEGHNIPSEVLVGTDSHTVTSGAFGTFAIGVGNTDAAFILGSGKMFLRVPETIRVHLSGDNTQHVLAKDLILELIGILGISGATYQAIEFVGDYLDKLTLEDRMTLCNMVIESGAKNGIMVPNKETLDYLSLRTDQEFFVTKPDEDATYFRDIFIDVAKLSPRISKPSSPDRVVDIDELENLPIQQAYLGSCTGGKTEDFLAAAKVLNGKKISIPTKAVPATKAIYESLRQMSYHGNSILSILETAGVIVSDQPSCAACCGGPKDTFGRVNEPVSVISSTNRNFPGRMGHKKAEIYLASPAVVAITAIEGKIVSTTRYKEYYHAKTL